jgi:3-hydroxy-9,10-secoandrosta-1,3,5(10)-triene-9,17-dione monooxygenase
MVPLRWGGYGLGWRTLIAASIEVGKACGSTAWCFSFFLGHEWLVGQYGEELRQQVWEDPRTLFGTSFAASGGKVRPVPGGYRLSGRWSWSSGIDYCHWVALGGLIHPHDGREAEMRMFALPRRDYQIEDVWNSSAMRGTGSNDIVVEDAFVPEEFTCRFNETLDGRPIEPMEDDPVNVWRSPFVTAFPLLVVGPILGLARGAYETFVGTMKTKVNAYTGQALSDLTPIQIRIAESAAELDAAELIVYNAIERLSTEKSIEKLRSVAFRALTYRDYILAAQMAVRSVDRLFSVSGARSLGADHPMQRHWRDIHAAASHIGMTVDPVYEGFGRIELGLPRNPGTVMY